MRVAFFTETFLPHVDGVVTRLLHTIMELRRAHDEVLVVAPNAPGLPESWGGAQVVGVPGMRFPLYREIRLGTPVPVAPMRGRFEAFAPQLLHMVNPITIGGSAIYYAWRHRVPLVASYHTNVPEYTHRYHLGATEGFMWAYLRGVHNRAQLNLCTSRPVKALLEGHGFRHVALWEPGVDAELFHPRHKSRVWRERLTGGEPDATILLYVGRLAAEKHLETLAPVLSRLPGCHLALVGDGPAAAAVQTAFAGLPVTFLGMLRGEELAAAYASADIFVLPSPTETLGLVAIEAMAAGLPVVGTRRGGIPDIVVDGETGILYALDEPDGLLRAVEALAHAPQLRERMGSAGRMRAEGWSWTATTAGLRAHYTRLAAGDEMIRDEAASA